MIPRASIAIGLLVAAALCGSLWIAYSAGHSNGVQDCQLAQAKQDKIDQQHRDEQIRQAEQVQDGLADKVQELERELAERKPEKEIVYQTITKEVIKYAQNNVTGRCQPDADFVRIWNAAKDGRNPAATGAGQRGNAEAVPSANH